MMYSIIIPTYRNPRYLKLCVDSIIENSFYRHQLCIHVNGYDKESVDYLDGKGIKYTISQDNIGIGAAVEMCLSQATKDYVLIANDDYYFTKGWDLILNCWDQELDWEFSGYKKFIGFQVCEPGFGSFPPVCSAGKSIDEFDVKKLYEYIEENSRHDIGRWLYGSIYPREIVNKFKASSEFYPKSCFDIDFFMQLRTYLVDKNIKFLLFSVKDCYIYHFQGKASIKSSDVKEESNAKLFEAKWRMGVKDAYNILDGDVDRSILLITNNARGEKDVS